ncbi:MAG: hypothetical protein FWE03_05700 [Firmicutes bacterium]|nr:hypothetical protein [Bacillota bacterium]
MKDNQVLAEALTAFFKECTMGVRKFSDNTIKDYKETLNRFIDYIKTKYKVSFEQISLAMFNAKSVVEYIAELKLSGRTTQVCNQKLQRIKTFVDYAASMFHEFIPLQDALRTVNPQRQEKIENKRQNNSFKLQPQKIELEEFAMDNTQDINKHYLEPEIKEDSIKEHSISYQPPVYQAPVYVASQSTPAPLPQKIVQTVLEDNPKLEKIETQLQDLIRQLDRKETDEKFDKLNTVVIGLRQEQQDHQKKYYEDKQEQHLKTFENKISELESKLNHPTTKIENNNQYIDKIDELTRLVKNIENTPSLNQYQQQNPNQNQSQYNANSMRHTGGNTMFTDYSTSKEEARAQTETIMNEIKNLHHENIKSSSELSDIKAQLGALGAYNNSFNMGQMIAKIDSQNYANQALMQMINANRMDTSLLANMINSNAQMINSNCTQGQTSVQYMPMPYGQTPQSNQPIIVNTTPAPAYKYPQNNGQPIVIMPPAYQGANNQQAPVQYMPMPMPYQMPMQQPMMNNAPNMQNPQVIHPQAQAPHQMINVMQPGTTSAIQPQMQPQIQAQTPIQTPIGETISQESHMHTRDRYKAFTNNNMQQPSKSETYSPHAASQTSISAAPMTAVEVAPAPAAIIVAPHKAEPATIEIAEAVVPAAAAPAPIAAAAPAAPVAVVVNNPVPAAAPAPVVGTATPAAAAENPMQKMLADMANRLNAMNDKLGD